MKDRNIVEFSSGRRFMILDLGNVLCPEIENKNYRNDPKFSDRQVWANSADPDQIAPMVEPRSSNFRVITTNFLGVQIFKKFMAIFQKNLTTTRNELQHDKTNKMTVRPAKTDQPGHPPNLIRVFAVR